MLRYREFIIIFAFTFLFSVLGCFSPPKTYKFYEGPELPQDQVAFITIGFGPIHIKSIDRKIIESEGPWPSAEDKISLTSGSHNVVVYYAEMSHSHGGYGMIMSFAVVHSGDVSLNFVVEFGKNYKLDHVLPKTSYMFEVNPGEYVVTEWNVWIEEMESGKKIAEGYSRIPPK